MSVFFFQAIQKQLNRNSCSNNRIHISNTTSEVSYLNISVFPFNLLQTLPEKLFGKSGKLHRKPFFVTYIKSSHRTPLKKLPQRSPFSVKLQEVKQYVPKTGLYHGCFPRNFRQIFGKFSEHLHSSKNINSLLSSCSLVKSSFLSNSRPMFPS